MFNEKRIEATEWKIKLLEDQVKQLEDKVAEITEWNRNQVESHKNLTLLCSETAGKHNLVAETVFKLKPILQELFNKMDERVTERDDIHRSINLIADFLHIKIVNSETTKTILKKEDF